MSTPGYLNFSNSYYIDLNEGQQQLYDHQVLRHQTTPLTLFSLQPHSSSASSSLSSSSSSFSSSSPVYLKPAQDQAGYCYMGSQLHPSPYQQEVDNFSSYGSGSYDQTTLEINKRTNNSLKFTICKKEDNNFHGGDCVDDCSGEASEINGSSVKWMSSKMRLMKKWMKSQEDQKRHPPPMEAESRLGNTLISRSSPNNSSKKNDNSSIRVCSDCSTTKTPLWRSGPKGPKSLCNACGIRQRKARRAMAAAAAASGSMIPNSPSSLMMRTGNSHKKGPNNNNGFGAQKKRSKVVKPSREHHHHDSFQRNLCFEEFALNLSKKLSLQQVFPQEEKEAAILLMALSCGLVHG